MTSESGIYLDDIRTPDEIPPVISDWIVVRSYEEFTKTFNEFYKEYKQLPKLISLDHDLTGEMMEHYFANPIGTAIEYDKLKDKTGMHVAKWICEVCKLNNIKLDNYIAVHSANPVGSMNIQGYINYFKKSQGLEENCFKNSWKIKDDYQDSEAYKSYLLIREKYFNSGENKIGF